MSRQKATETKKLEHIKGRYGIIVALIAAISGTISIPYICNKEPKAGSAKNQKNQIATNQNSPVANEVGTQNIYYNSPAKDTIKLIPGHQPEHTGQKISHSTSPRITSTDRIYAPNASIVTQNQSGGSNTVIVADSYEKKLKTLMNTPPDVSYKFYIQDSAIYCDVNVKNDVPVAFYARFHLYEDEPFFSKRWFHGKTLYPDVQRKYTFRIDTLYSRSLYMDQIVFKARLTVSIQSIYYNEIQTRPLWKRIERVYLFDRVNKTITMTDDSSRNIYYQGEWE